MIMNGGAEQNDRGDNHSIVNILSEEALHQLHQRSVNANLATKWKGRVLSSGGREG